MVIIESNLVQVAYEMLNANRSVQLALDEVEMMISRLKGSPLLSDEDRARQIDNWQQVKFNLERIGSDMPVFENSIYIPDDTTFAPGLYA